jgi:hypothetical protein
MSHPSSEVPMIVYDLSQPNTLIVRSEEELQAALVGGWSQPRPNFSEQREEPPSAAISLPGEEYRGQGPSSFRH